jgi:hypothetical protein
VDFTPLLRTWGSSLLRQACLNCLRKSHPILDKMDTKLFIYFFASFWLNEIALTFFFFLLDPLAFKKHCCCYLHLR